MKKIISLLFCCILFLNIVSCTTKTNQIQNTTIWTAESTDKILRSDKVKSTSNELTLLACKGEKESGQIIISSNININKIEIKVDDFLNENGKIISADNVSLYREHYFNINSTVEKFPSGWYPDALIPFDLSENKGENIILANQNFTILFQINIPYSSDSGIFTSKFTIKLDNKSYSVDIKINVFDFSLSPQNHVKTAFAIWDYQICDYWGMNNPDIHHIETLDEFSQLIENYYDFLANYRISPTDLPLNYIDIKDTTKVVECVKKISTDNRIASYNIPTSTYTTGNNTFLNTYKLKETLTALVNNSTEKMNLLEKAYLYIPLIDEPYYQGLTNLCNQVNDAVEEIRLELLNTLDFSEKENVKASLKNFSHVVTTKYYSEYDGHISTWCPQFDELDSIENRNFYNQRKLLGEHLWWYGCVSPTYPYPTFHIDDTLLSNRITGFMQKYYNIEGQLYWTTTLTQKMTSNGYISRDIWNDPISFNNIPGDGFLLYPGAKYGIDKPIASLRLNSLCDGFEDYEYLWLLEQALNSYNNKMGKNINFRSTVEKIANTLFDGTKPQADSLTLKSAKQKLAELIIFYSK